MPFMTRSLLIGALMISLISPAYAAPAKKSGASTDALKQQVDDLRRNTSDNALREKIIRMALGMKPAPAVPEEAERSVVRGTSFFQKASDVAGYKKAIREFEAATNAAPWLAIAYYNLGVAQEKAGLYAEAIQSLKFYLMAAPDAKNTRDVKDKIYALEVDVEDLQASKNAPAPAPSAASAPAPAASPSAPGKSLDIAAKPTLGIEPVEKNLNILKLPAEKKTKLPDFTGTWFFKDVLRGEELTIQAFEISRNAGGDLVVTPPKRAADSYASITQFEINDRRLKLQMKWKMKSVVGYWKTETYDLTMSGDGKTLSGSHNQKSVGGRNIDMDRVLFRQ